MDYRLNPPTRGFTKFELRRSFGSDELELYLLESSYILDPQELSIWLHAVGFQQAQRVIDCVHNCQRVECDLQAQTFAVPADQSVESEESDEIEVALHSIIGTRIPFDPSLVVSPFDNQIGMQPPAHYLRSNRNGQ